MRPPFVRIMVADGWNYMVNGKFSPSKSEAVLTKILDFCQAEGIEVLLGDASLLPGRKFDIILANINRNILLNDMDKYAAGLEPGGVLFISGFYTEDIPVLQEKALTHSLHIIYHHQKNNWAVVKLEKR